MFDNNVQKYKKAFVFGTGGGNDIVSAVLVAMYLQRFGVKTDVGGILSPAAVHRFDRNLEQVVNKIEGKIRRSIPAKNPVDITFIDEHLPKAVADVGVKVENFYELSIRFGTDKLVEGVNELVKENAYDLVVAADVGGDILARGVLDSTVLSPIMDFTSLYLLNEINVDSMLVEFGLGTDGELRPAGMKNILRELRSKGLMQHESYISRQDREVKTFKQIFDSIKHVRAGHTAVMTLETLETLTPDEDIVSQYRFRSRVGKKKWLTPYEVTLPHEFFGKTFVIDGKGLAQERKKTAFAYKNPLEQYVKLKEIKMWKTELDLFYLWSGDNWTTAECKDYCMLLLVPSTAIPEPTRRDIIQEGYNNLRDNCDLAMVHKNDLKHLQSDLGLTYSAGEYCLITQREGMRDFMRETAKRIEKYQNNS